jgi:hypothetical protein
VAPGLVATGDEYFRAFAAASFVLAACLVLLSGVLAEQTGGNRRAALLVTAGAPIFLGGVLRTRYDLAPTVMMVAALALLCSGRPRSGLVLLGLGTMTKGFPLLVAPVALSWLWGRGEHGAAFRSAGALLTVLAVLSLLSFALSSTGALDAVRFQAERPVQIESSPAMVLIGLDALGLSEAQTVDSHRSFGLEDPRAGPLLLACAVAFVAVVCALSLAAARDGSTRSLVLAGLGTVLGFVALGKVLSPQFLIWTLPLLALAVAWRMWALAATLGSASVLTFIEFPRQYFGGLLELKAFPVILVSVRDALLIVAMVLVLRAVPPGGTGECKPTDVKPPRPRWRSRRTVADASPGRKLGP